MWATWVDYLRQDVGYMGQPRAKTGAKLRPNRANIGLHRPTNNNDNLGPQGQTTTTTTTTTTTYTRSGHGSAFAGARLSGVSLINPGAGPGAVPVALPEAFGW